MMIKLNNLIIIPVKAHMAKPCDTGTKMLSILQSSFRWRLMRVAREAAAKMSLSQPTGTCTQSLFKNTGIREHQS
ncbi:MAG: hypothetical protein CVU35_05315 [Betaproteobacteria bacterium HGW-Betaproteobacteria-8]|nr:MAG: hypothetical protein CVU35_05315 [Betaproteobacteria bacterium HGW-Betaproteobacteria-8]